MADIPEPLDTLSIAEARATFGPSVGKVQYGDGYIEITKNGKTAAYLVSPELFTRLTQPPAIETDEEN